MANYETFLQTPVLYIYSILVMSQLVFRVKWQQQLILDY